MDIAMIGLIFSIVATVTTGGWVILHSVSSQLSAFRLELESKIDAVDDRLSVRMQKLEDRMEGRMDRMEGRMDRMEGRMQKLEDGLIGLGQQIARLEGMLIRRPSSEEHQPA